MLGGAPELVDLVSLEHPGRARGREERARTVGCLEPERGELDLLASREGDGRDDQGEGAGEGVDLVVQGDGDQLALGVWMRVISSSWKSRSRSASL